MKLRDISEGIEDIKAENDIIETILSYMSLKPMNDMKSDNYMGTCPFCHATNQFFAYESKQMFYCFGCGEGGNVARFIMKIEHLNMIDAIEFLASKWILYRSQYISAKRNNLKAIDVINQMYNTNDLKAIIRADEAERQKENLKYGYTSFISEGIGDAKRRKKYNVNWDKYLTSAMELYDLLKLYFEGSVENSDLYEIALNKRAGIIPAIIALCEN